MDYRFFESLSAGDAREYLEAFLRAGRSGIGERWWERLRADGTAAIPAYFADVAGRIRVVNVAAPADVPSFIVEAMERDHGGFRDFSGDDDRAEVLRAAFFLGEAFIHEHASLSWAVGRSDRAEQGQPVVTSFATDSDLPALLVAENLLLAFEPDRAAVAVATWEGVV